MHHSIRIFALLTSVCTLIVSMFATTTQADTMDKPVLKPESEQVEMLPERTSENFVVEDVAKEESADATQAESGMEKSAEQQAEDNNNDVVEPKPSEDGEGAVSPSSELNDAENGFEVAGQLSADELGENRGTYSASTMSYMLATSSGNTANNTISGANSISDNAFSNTSGVISVIQNSGNNVLIQNSTIVNLEMYQ